MASHPRVRRLAVAALALVLAVGPLPGTARADNNLIGGIADIVGGALSLPVGILQGTMSGPPILGTLGGAVGGALNTISLTTRGVFRLIGVAIPLAAKIAPLIPLFL